MHTHTRTQFYQSNLKEIFTIDFICLTCSNLSNVTNITEALGDNIFPPSMSFSKADSIIARKYCDTLLFELLL